MNEYLKNLDKIEFVVTLACTGRCRHCQNGDPPECSAHIDAHAAQKAIREICEEYRIKTVMTFGGEPLLYPGTVCAIHRTATELDIARRQVITNGFFSNDKDKIEKTARELAESGVNEMLLSVDAFHQETIPLEPVMYFADRAVFHGIPVRLSPAWLVSREDGNPYNVKTREVISKFDPQKITVCPGNVVFPGGNALKYLREYFDENVTPSSPYYEDPRDVRTLSFEPDGGVLDGNAYKTDIMEIIRTYRPMPE